MLEMETTMEGFGVCMADRSFECILCRQRFTRFCGDAILIAENLICDNCLAELQQLEEDELRRQVSERLEKNPPRPSQEFENEVIQIIRKHGQRGKGIGATPKPS